MLAIRRPFVARVQALKVVAVQFVNHTLAGGRFVDLVIVHHHQLTVARDEDVELENVYAETRRRSKGAHGLTRPLAITASMCDDFRRIRGVCEEWMTMSSRLAVYDRRNRCRESLVYVEASGCTDRHGRVLDESPSIEVAHTAGSTC